jgi:hypothetical protein
MESQDNLGSRPSPTLPVLPLLFLALVPQVSSGLHSHWVLEPENLVDGVFQPIKGDFGLKTLGPARFLQDKNGAAWIFSPGDPGLSISTEMPPSNLPGKKMSVAVWVAMDESLPWGGILGAVEDNGSDESGWVLGSRGSRFTFGLATEGRGNLLYLNANQTFRPARWYHLVGTWDGKIQQIWIDGELQAESKDQGGEILYSKETYNFVAGAYLDKDENYPMVGALREVRLYERALSRVEIIRLFKGGKGKLPAIEGPRASGTPSGPSLNAMQARINSAIGKGRDHLLSNQARDGSWLGYDNYPNGITALTLYAILESGILPSHPSVQNALTFLGEADPQKTYSAGIQLMAYAASENPSVIPHAERIVGDLLAWERKGQPGTWGYPTGPVDLSNTQFAALGFWAANRMGIEIPAEVWRRMIETVVDSFQEEAEKGIARTQGDLAAGYSYFPGGRSYPVSGSMTTAGLCVTALAEHCCPTLGRRWRTMAEKSRKRALAWLEENYTVRSNPGSGSSPFYYLYGMERVGALLESDKIGPFDWYRDGAEVLLESQKATGEWGGLVDSNFALLFLNRATSPSSGGTAEETPPGVWAQPKGPIRFRATGIQRLAMMLEGFAEDLLVDGKGPKVAEVDYLVDGILVATVKGVASARWDGARLAARAFIRVPGKHTVQVRVRFADGREVESFPLAISISRDPAEFQREAMERIRPNLLDRIRPTVTASSNEGDAFKVNDLLQKTGWACGAQDPQPWIRLELPSPVDAGALFLCPVDSRISTEGNHDHVRRVAISLDRGDFFEAELDSDPLAVTVIPFPESGPVRKIEVHILDRSKGTRHPGRAGFAEIGLRP